jgi:peptidoglycan hydrolase-like protein with peptidoglycan-binding domain
MRVLNFSDFIQISEAASPLKAELIGDSSVGLYKSLVPNVQISFPSLNKSGWSTFDLLKALKSEGDTNPDVRLVFIGIGSNDLYQDTPAVQKAALEIRQELSRIFPNAEYIVIKGGWGWGGLKSFQGYSEPQELKDYYQNVWKNAGFKVMDQSQGYSPEHHTTQNAGIRNQANSITSIISGKTGLYDVQGSTSDSSSLEAFYDVLEDHANSQKTIVQQKPGTYAFDPVIQNIQIGLKFLGIDLPRFGADGLYGPETAESIQDFKSQFSLDGDGSEFGPDDTIALISSLKNSGFDLISLKSVQRKSEEMLDDQSLITGDTDYLYYLQHQQGAAGASSLIKAASGEGKLNPATRANSGRFLTQNMPDGDIADQISAAIDAGDDQRAAILFLNYWKNFWAFKKDRALTAIQQPKYSNIKSAIDAVQTNLPKDFLYTVAFVESGLQAKPREGGKYKGLFAITDQNLKKYVPDGNIYNANDNAKAAIMDMEKNIQTFQKLAGSSLKSQNFA